MTTERCYIGGIIEGINYPKNRFTKVNPFLNLDDCKDLIIVDRKYFCEHYGLIKAWAFSFEDKK